jgi:hypothetical protein
VRESVFIANRVPSEEVITVKTARTKAPELSEVIRVLGLETDQTLASLLVEWYKARKAWLRHKEGTTETRARTASIRAVDDYLANDPDINRKARLMNEMINRFS